MGEGTVRLEVAEGIARLTFDHERRLNPQRYFTDVLTRLVNGWMENRLDELMPWHWAASKNS